MSAKLYAMAHSHPAVAARLMLEHKRIEHEVWNILPGLHPLVVRAAGFPGRTVPALRIGDERIQGSLRISRALDELDPERPLFPADPSTRRAVGPDRGVVGCWSDTRTCVRSSRAGAALEPRWSSSPPTPNASPPRCPPSGCARRPGATKRTSSTAR